MTRLFTKRTDPAEPDAAALVAELDAHLCSLYAAERRHLLDIDALRQPPVVFITAQTPDGERLGCAALVNHDGEYGELKRMYVRPAHRGAGVALLLLADLQTRARILRLPVLCLETGIHQIEALRFYEKSGSSQRLTPNADKELVCKKSFVNCWSATLPILRGWSCAGAFRYGRNW